mgnify:CR=1 FL=1
MEYFKIYENGFFLRLQQFLTHKNYSYAIDK